MCRDQDLISETDVRTYGRTYGRTYERMKIEKPVLGRPPLGPANREERMFSNENSMKVWLNIVYLWILGTCRELDTLGISEPELTEPKVVD